MTDVKRLIDPKDLPPDNKRTLHLGEEEIILDADKLVFNEASLNHFQDRLAVWYDYFGEKQGLAEFLVLRREAEYEAAYSRHYAEHKENGATDKLAEAKSKADSEVQEAKRQVALAKQRLTQIKLHIKAWDKAHDNAKERGYMMRKEMDKLQSDISHKDHDLAEQTRKYLGDR
jgi:chromosome segregation ATPase